MPRSSSTQLQKVIDEQSELIDQVASLVSDMLDPILTREELVEKLQELDDLLPEVEEEEEEEEEEGDDA